MNRGSWLFILYCLGYTTLLMQVPAIVNAIENTIQIQLNPRRHAKDNRHPSSYTSSSFLLPAALLRPPSISGQCRQRFPCDTKPPLTLRRIGRNGFFPPISQRLVFIHVDLMIRHPCSFFLVHFSSIFLRCERACEFMLRTTGLCIGWWRR